MFLEKQQKTQRMIQKSNKEILGSTQMGTDITMCFLKGSDSAQAAKAASQTHIHNQVLVYQENTLLHWQKVWTLPIYLSGNHLPTSEFLRSARMLPALRD